MLAPQVWPAFQATRVACKMRGRLSATKSAKTVAASTGKWASCSLGPAAGPPLSLTTTVLPEHLVRSTNGGYGTGQKDCHFRVEGGVALT